LAPGCAVPVDARQRRPGWHPTLPIHL